MLKVKTRLDISETEGIGIGLFANESIKKGTIIWEFANEIDTTYTNNFIKKCKEKNLISFLKKYCYFDLESELYIFCGDNGRFINHSDKPNCKEELKSKYTFGRTIAVRNIKKGEELTCDYYEFDGEADEKLNP